MAFVWRYFYGPADDGAAAPAPAPKKAAPSPPPPPSAAPTHKLLPVAAATVAAVRAAARADGTDAALAASGEPLDDLAARRWLHACGGDAGAATASLRAHAAWRRATAPGGTVPAAAFAAVAARPKICLQGLDARGRPVLLLRAALHARGHAAANAALVCYALDAAERLTRRHPHPLNPEHRILVLFDLARVRPSNCDVRALASIFDVLKRHYPERLDALLFLNAPPLFGSLYALISPMVVDGVRRKIAFVPRGAKGAKRVLKPLLPPSVWPASLGGDAPEVAVQAAVAAAAAPRGFLGFPAAAARGSAAALLRLAPRPLARTAAVLAAVAALAVAALASALRWAVWGQALGAGSGKGKAARARRATPPPADDCCTKPAVRQADADAADATDAADAEPAWMAFGPPPAAGLDLLWAGGLAPLADA